MVVTFLTAMAIPDSALMGLIIGSGAVSTVLLLIARPRVRDTTLAAVGVWALVAIVMVAATELAIYLLADQVSANRAEAMRWVAACSTFCPMMAQLGAKRPQDRGWQWIVLSLWVILALPAGKALLLERALQISPIWWGFAWTLVAIGVFNMLPTRYRNSIVWVGAAQCALLWYCGANIGSVIGSLMLAMAIVEAYRARPAERISTATPLDRVWLDFRDMFGVVWALRIAEQLNKSSEMYDWGVTAGWDGFVDSKSGERVTELDEATETAITKSLRTMLRRFVSPEWLDVRLADADEGDLNHR